MENPSILTLNSQELIQIEFLIHFPSLMDATKMRKLKRYLKAKRLISPTIYERMVSMLDIIGILRSQTNSMGCVYELLKNAFLHIDEPTLSIICDFFLRRYRAATIGVQPSEAWDGVQIEAIEIPSPESPTEASGESVGIQPPTQVSPESPTEIYIQSGDFQPATEVSRESPTEASGESQDTGPTTDVPRESSPEASGEDQGRVQSPGTPGPDDRHPSLTEIFMKEYEKVIHSIVNLGNEFVVVLLGESTRRKHVVVHDTSGEQLQTQTSSHIEGLLKYLAWTLIDNTLWAICCEPDESLCIGIYDHMSGSLTSCTPKFKVGAEVCGFAVFDENHFVILHGVDDECKISVISRDGSIVLTKDIKSHSKFVSCGGGGRHIFISRGDEYVDVFELLTDEQELIHITSSKPAQFVSCVSAANNQVTVLCAQGNGYPDMFYLGKATFEENEFSAWEYKEVGRQDQCLLSVSGDHVMVVGVDDNDWMNVLRVFKEEGTSV